jgi:hypothetical protein
MNSFNSFDPSLDPVWSEFRSTNNFGCKLKRGEYGPGTPIQSAMYP